MLGVTNLLDVELSVEQASIAESLVPSPDLEPTVWRNDRLGVDGVEGHSLSVTVLRVPEDRLPDGR